jgi:hypothetical protein
MVTQERLRACAAELQKISEMMLEVAQLRDAVQEMGQRIPRYVTSPVLQEQTTEQIS